MITSGGPSGIRTQDRRIKSQWLKLQNSTKNARKRTKLQENARRRTKKRRSQAANPGILDTKW